jgi:hypothetical protein
MTSQVSVINMDGVAIASDTLVTVGEKTIPNDSKIVTLGQDHKCVVLISGSAHMNRVSVRQLLNKWALSLTSVPSGIYDYANSFNEWCKKESKSGDGLLTKMQELDILRDFVNNVIYGLAQRLKRSWDSQETPDPYVYLPEGSPDSELKENPIYAKAIKEHTQNSLVEEMEYWRTALKPFYGFNEEDARNFLKSNLELLTYVSEKSGEFRWWGYGFADNSKKTKDLLFDFVSLLLAREWELSGDTTIAFIGYGKDENLPATLELRCRGIYNNQLMYAWDRSETEGTNLPFWPKSVTPFNIARVDYFAQSNAILGFFHGISEDSFHQLNRSIERTLSKFIDEIYSEMPNKEEIIKSKTEEIFEPVLSDDDADSNLPDNFRKSIGAMGLTNLAELAETLVRLQHLSSYGKDGAITVGGTVETLTIDVIHGVRWHHRVPIGQ